MTQTEGKNFKAAISIARRARTDNPDVRIDVGHGDPLDDCAPSCIATEGGYLVEAWLFVCSEAVTEELRDETAQRLEEA